MWFMECFIIIICSMAFIFFAGQPLLLYLNRKSTFLTVDRFCLSLLYGTFTISYLFFIGTYCNLPGKYIGPIIISSVITSTLLLKNKWRSEIKTKQLIQFLLVCFAVISISLLPLLIYNSFNVFNDAIGYISISDYLYNHSFLKKYDDTSGLRPLESIILIDQNSRARMGGNFFIAALQSIIEVPKSIFIFPVVQTLGMILVLAGMVVSARWLFHLSWKYTLIILFLATVTFNPLYYSIHYGFNNQLYGSAYFLLTLASFSRLIQKSSSQNARQFVLITAIFIAALILFYPELFIFAFLALTLSICVPFIRSKTDKKRWFLMLSGLTVLSILISNIGFIGLFYFLPGQVHAIAGWNINYSQLEFLSTAIGIMPLQSSNLLAITLGCILLIIFLFSIYKIVANNLARYFTWISTMLIFAGVYLYFNFFVANPWLPNTMGQSWNLFKLTNWAYPCIMLGLGYGISRLRLNKTILMLIIACIPISIKTHPSYFNQALIANRITNSDHPFNDFEKFAKEVKNIDTDLPIELISDNKKTLAYYMSPKPMFADWRGDCYLSNMKQKYMNIQMDKRHYIIADSQYALTDKAKPLSANTVLIDSTMSYIKFYKGFYELESSGGSSWRWSSGDSTIGLKNGKNQRVKMKFNVHFLSTPAKLILQVSNQAPIEFIVINKEWTTLEFVTNLKKGDSTLSFKTNMRPEKVGEDPRALAFAFSELRQVVCDD